MELIRNALVCLAAVAVATVGALAMVWPVLYFLGAVPPVVVPGSGAWTVAAIVGAFLAFSLAMEAL
jgi:hypothetical protein